MALARDRKNSSLLTSSSVWISPNPKLVRSLSVCLLSSPSSLLLPILARKYSYRDWASGGGTKIWCSRRPGRRRAESMTWGREEAPRRITCGNMSNRREHFLVDRVILAGLHAVHCETSSDSYPQAIIREVFVIGNELTLSCIALFLGSRIIHSFQEPNFCLF